MIPPTGPQSHKGRGMASLTPGKQQGIFNCNPPFPICLSSGQKPLGSQHPQISKASRSGAPLPGFCPRALGSQLPRPHQLRQPHVPKMPPVFDDARRVASVAAAAAAAGTTAVSRELSMSHVDDSIQPHFDSNSIFTKAPARAPLAAPTLPSQQTVVPPNQVAPGGRPGQKVSAALGNQSLRQSPVQGPVPVLSAAKSRQQGMASFGPMSPIQGMEPPSYVAAAVASAIAASKSPGPFGRMGAPPKLPPYDFLPPAPAPTKGSALSP